MSGRQGLELFERFRRIRRCDLFGGNVSLEIDFAVIHRPRESRDQGGHTARLPYLLGRENRRDFMSLLRAGGVGTGVIRSGVETERKVLKETTGKSGRGISGSGKNPVQGNLPRIYKDDPG